MRLSVLIPSYKRPAAIDRCLRHLAEHPTPAELEIIVGMDGGADETPDPVVPGPIQGKTRLVRLPRLGVIGVRRELLRLAQGETVLWLNDDAYAHPGLLDAHLRAHEATQTRVVSGGVRWQPIPVPTLFDAIVQSTDIIFFHQSQQRADAGLLTPTTYRSCFGLNMSFPLAFARETGGIPDISEPYGFDDIELAHRLQAAGATLLHAPNAIVTHDHRMSPADVHRREYLLGRAAWQYAGANAAFAKDLFRRDIRGNAEQEYCEAFLMRERGDAERIERSFLDLASHPVDAATPELLPVLAQQWVLLKRYLWRWGLLDAARGTPARWSPVAEIQGPFPDE